MAKHWCTEVKDTLIDLVNIILWPANEGDCNNTYYNNAASINCNVHTANAALTVKVKTDTMTVALNIRQTGGS